MLRACGILAAAGCLLAPASVGAHQPSAEVLKTYLGLDPEDLLPKGEDDPMYKVYKAAAVELKDNGGGTFGSEGYWGLNLTLLDIGARPPHTLGKMWGKWNNDKQIICEDCDTDVDYERSGFGKVFTADGEAVTHEDALLDVFDDEDHLYMVPNTEQFVWPLAKVGHKAMPPIKTKKGRVRVQLLEQNPRVFQVHNFITDNEVAQLLTAAKRQEAHDSQGAAGARHEGTVPAFTVKADIAKTIAKRAFDVLRVPFKEELLEDMIVYKHTPGVEPPEAETDYFATDTTQDFNWDPSKHKGANRFATLLLHLSDASELEGGQTIFPDAQSTSELEAADTAEECKLRFSVKPEKGKTILFYSQQPDGRLNSDSAHGECALEEGTMWLAKLRVWNNARYNSGHKPSGPVAFEKPTISVKFENHHDKTVEVFYVATPGAPEVSMGVLNPLPTAKRAGSRKVLGPDNIEIKTFDGHTFVARPKGGGNPLAIYTMNSDHGLNQTKPVPDPELMLMLEKQNADRPIDRILNKRHSGL